MQSPYDSVDLAAARDTLDTVGPLEPLDTLEPPGAKGIKRLKGIKNQGGFNLTPSYPDQSTCPSLALFVTILPQAPPARLERSTYRFEGLTLGTTPKRRFQSTDYALGAPQKTSPYAISRGDGSSSAVLAPIRNQRGACGLCNRAFVRKSPSHAARRACAVPGKEPPRVADCPR